MSAAPLEAALRGDLAVWRGLPDDLDDDALAAVAGPGEGPSAGRLSGMPVRVREDRGTLGRLRAWFDDDDRAFLIWADAPPFGRPAGEILDELSEPEKRLTDRPSRFPGTVQWVWAERGLTAYVAEDEHDIRALALFRPGTVAFYEQWLGAGEGPPYRPRRER